MFEGKLPQPGDDRPFDLNSADSERLRAISWGDLVARLAAARELRGALDLSATARDASFDADSARRIAAHHNGKHGVNLEDSGDGKDSGGTAPEIQDEARFGTLPRAARN